MYVVFLISRLFMKLFKTNNIERLNSVKISLDLVSPCNVLSARSVGKSDNKFVASKNAFCELILSLYSTS